jgi:hypothetical protein
VGIPNRSQVGDRRVLTERRVKMYRTRIRKWGIDKNNKAAEVAYMLRLKKQRDVVGKKSCFFIRNRPVDW